MERTLDPSRKFCENTTQSSSLGFKLACQHVNVFAQSLLESIQSVDLILSATPRLTDDLSRPLLSSGGELSRLRLSFLLGVLDELLGHHDHRRDLLGTGAGGDHTRGGRRGGGRGRDAWSAHLTTLELIDSFARLTQLLAHLVQLVFQLTSFERDPLQELIDLVDVIALESDFECHRVNGVEGRKSVIRTIHAVTIPPNAGQRVNCRPR